MKCIAFILTILLNQSFIPKDIDDLDSNILNLMFDKNKVTLKSKILDELDFEEKHGWLKLNQDIIESITMTSDEQLINDVKIVHSDVMFKVKIKDSFLLTNWFEELCTEIETTRLRSTIEVKPGMLIYKNGENLILVILNLCKGGYDNFKNLLIESRKSYVLLDCAGKNMSVVR